MCINYNFKFKSKRLYQKGTIDNIELENTI